MLHGRGVFARARDCERRDQQQSGEAHCVLLRDRAGVLGRAELLLARPAAYAHLVRCLRELAQHGFELT